jgi:hypothetical protein
MSAELSTEENRSNRLGPMSEVPPLSHVCFSSQKATFRLDYGPAKAITGFSYPSAEHPAYWLDLYDKRISIIVDLTPGLRSPVIAFNQGSGFHRFNHLRFELEHNPGIRFLALDLTQYGRTHQLGDAHLQPVHVVLYDPKRCDIYECGSTVSHWGFQEGPTNPEAQDFARTLSAEAHRWVAEVNRALGWTESTRINTAEETILDIQLDKANFEATIHCSNSITVLKRTGLHTTVGHRIYTSGKRNGEREHLNGVFLQYARCHIGPTTLRGMMEHGSPYTNSLSAARLHDSAEKMFTQPSIFLTSENGPVHIGTTPSPYAESPLSYEKIRDLCGDALECCETLSTQLRADDFK